MTTAKTAPIMLGIPDLGADNTEFDQLTFWGVDVRGMLNVLAFLATMWALAV